MLLILLAGERRARGAQGGATRAGSTARVGAWRRARARRQRHGALSLQEREDGFTNNPLEVLKLSRIGPVSCFLLLFFSGILVKQLIGPL